MPAKPYFFYVILRDDDNRLFRHGDPMAAQAEAARLAAANPGHGFYICKAMSVAEKEPPPPPTSIPEGVRFRQPEQKKPAPVHVDVDDDLPF